MSIGGAALTRKGFGLADLNQFQFKFEKESITSILVGDTLANPKILKRLKLTPNPNEELPNDSSRDNFFVWGLGKRLTGVGTVRMGIFRSTDGGVSWTELSIVGYSSVGFTDQIQDGHRGNMSLDTTDIIIGARNTDGATTGEIKNFKATMAIDTPLGMKIEEIL